MVGIQGEYGTEGEDTVISKTVLMFDVSADLMEAPGFKAA